MHYSSVYYIDVVWQYGTAKPALERQTLCFLHRSSLNALFLFEKPAQRHCQIHIQYWAELFKFLLIVVKLNVAYSIFATLI